jgi:hypothetical protein
LDWKMRIEQKRKVREILSAVFADAPAQSWSAEGCDVLNFLWSRDGSWMVFWFMMVYHWCRWILRYRWTGHVCPDPWPYIHDFAVEIAKIGTPTCFLW